MQGFVKHFIIFATCLTISMTEYSDCYVYASSVVPDQTAARGTI